MSKSNQRVVLTVRLDSEDKQLFSTEAEKCGLDPGVAARQILELYIQRLKDGGDYVDALHELKSAWKVPGKAA